MRVGDDPVVAPAWVIPRLLQLGLGSLGGPTAADRPSGRAKARWCTCRQPVLTGIAWPFAIRVDPWPTTVEGEGFAVLAGRATAWLQLDGTMQRRGSGEWPYSSADDIPVHVEHRCGGPWPPVSERHRPASALPADTPPPF